MFPIQFKNLPSAEIVNSSVANATDAAVVVMQYEQLIRKGHFLIIEKKNQTQTSVLDSHLDSSRLIVLNGKPLLFPSGCILC